MQSRVMHTKLACLRYNHPQADSPPTCNTHRQRKARGRCQVWLYEHTYPAACNLLKALRRQKPTPRISTSRLLPRKVLMLQSRLAQTMPVALLAHK